MSLTAKLANTRSDFAERLLATSHENDSRAIASRVLRDRAANAGGRPRDHHGATAQGA
jgi:hypothetical protein